MKNKKEKKYSPNEFSTLNSKKLSDVDLKQATKVKKETPKINKIKLKYPIKHLKGFNDLNKALKLYGKEYIIIKKALWYNLHSTVISKSNISYMQLNVDGRLFLLIPLKSGKGKSNIKHVIKNVSNNLGISAEEPTSLHPEQLVGKVTSRKKRDGTDYYAVEGYLSRDFLIIDEGRELLTSEDLNYSESRKYLRLAFDKYGNNEIMKKPVGIPFGEELRYFPHCCSTIFVQPYRFNESFVTDGDFRRYITPYVNMTGINRQKSYLNRLTDDTDSEKVLNNFTNYLNTLDPFDSFDVSKEAGEALKECSIYLIDRGWAHSEKIKYFIELYDYNIQDMLLKMSAIQALQENTNLITEKHVYLAFIDYAEFLEHMYNFILQKISGDFDYGEKWMGATGPDQEILKWLLDEDATSLNNSKTSINDLIEKIKEIHSVKKRQAQYIKKKYEESGWIKSKQAGPYGTVVWLNLNVNYDNSRDAKDAMNAILPENFQEYYNEKINEWIAPITPPAPLEDKKTKKPFLEIKKNNLQKEAYAELTNEELSNKALYEEDEEASHELSRRLFQENKEASK
jgi:hypothetical protein